MKITLLCIGKVKEPYLREGVEEFKKRLQKYCSFQIIEIKDATPAKETEQILAKLSDAYVVILDQKGKELTSEAFAAFLKKQEKEVIFVLGGPDGLTEQVKNQADLLLSLSQMTMLHEQCRLFFIEQLYRAFTILKGEKYHK